MIRGFYTAATGLQTQSKVMDVLANNFANADTPGYKKDILVTTSFGQYMATQQGQPVGEMTFGNRVAGTFTSFEQGATEQTGRTLDICIHGAGFFNVQLPDGGSLLTRNGRFFLNEEGYLVTAQGYLVQGQNGPIQVGTADFTVDPQGQIFVDGQYVDTLDIVCPADWNGLAKVGEGYFVNPQNRVPFTGVLEQGAIELSNMDIIQQMTDMLSSFRNYQTCSQIVRMLDQIMQKSANEVGRI